MRLKSRNLQPMHVRLLLVMAVFILLCSATFTHEVEKQASAVTATTFTVTAESKPYQSKYTTYQTYNAKTRQYYTLRSYLEQLEKSNGGVLILEKGTYVIINTLSIPSGVTIKLKNGVRLVKGDDTHTKGLTPSKTLFQFVSSDKADKIAAISNYDGVYDSKLIGEGTAVIDLNYISGATAVVLGHNSDIVIEGITFQKMQNAGFIKMGGSKNIIIRANTFRYHKTNNTGNGEAIALETPDSTTKSFSYVWSKKDKTVNQNILIEDNNFYGIIRAVGTTKYTEGKYHKNIKIIGNTIRETASHAIRILNWTDCVIKDNQFSEIRNSEGTLKAILTSGAVNPRITANTFHQTDRAIQIMPWKNNNGGSEYAITYNDISEQNKKDMQNNILQDMDEYVIRYNKIYNEYTKGTEKWEINDTFLNTFNVSPDS